MVENKIIQIIYDNLTKYVSKQDVKCYVSNGFLKYILNIDIYFIEICYFFMDDFYTIKIENKKNNELKNVVFLSKSKKFHKDIKKKLKEFKLKRKSFENHVYCFTMFIKKLLDDYDSLSGLEETYVSDLKFDGVFI